MFRHKHKNTLRSLEVKARAHPVIPVADRDGCYTVIVPSLPRCVTEGGTLAEALSNAVLANQMYESVRAEHHLSPDAPVSELLPSVGLFPEHRKVLVVHRLLPEYVQVAIGARWGSRAAWRNHHRACVGKATSCPVVLRNRGRDDRRHAYVARTLRRNTLVPLRAVATIVAGCRLDDEQRVIDRMPADAQPHRIPCLGGTRRASARTAG